MKRHEEGITLIALIVTIVILIILTAITISNVMGSNLFGLAKGAVENYIEAEKEEQDAIDNLISKVGGTRKDKIQPTEPTITITDGTNENQSEYIRVITVTITPGTDEESGVKETTYSITGPETKSGTIETTQSNATETLTKVGTYTITATTIDNEDNISEVVSRTVTKTPIPTTSGLYVGCYADVDDNGTVDGIIYADLAVGNTKNGTWGTGDTVSTYNIEPVKDKSTLAEYYVKKEGHEGPFGVAEVIAPISKDTNIENDRFYVMALEDLDKKQNGAEYDWYNAAGNKMTDYAETTKTGFGEGRTNTTNMMAKWNDPKLPYGEHDQCSEHKDMWGQIGDLVDKGWFVPSKDEWSAFGGELGITESSETDGYYVNKGLSGYYWSSSQIDVNYAWWAGFYVGSMYGNLVYNYEHVRLSTTF